MDVLPAVRALEQPEASMPPPRDRNWQAEEFTGASNRSELFPRHNYMHH